MTQTMHRRLGRSLNISTAAFPAAIMLHHHALLKKNFSVTEVESAQKCVVDGARDEMGHACQHVDCHDALSGFVTEDSCKLPAEVLSNELAQHWGVASLSHAKVRKRSSSISTPRHNAHSLFKQHLQSLASASGSPEYCPAAYESSTAHRQHDRM